MNPWTLLGVKPGDSEADLTRAFRQKMFDAHPDRVGGSEVRAKALSTAYGELRGHLVDGRLASEAIPRCRVVRRGVVVTFTIVGGASSYATASTTNGYTPTGSW